ncbi:unnamed protein product [Caenorhabditis nigoni]
MMVDAQKFNDNREWVKVNSEDEPSLHESGQDVDGDSNRLTSNQQSLPLLAPTRTGISRIYGLLDVFRNSSGNYLHMFLATILAILKNKLRMSIFLFPARQLYMMVTYVSLSQFARKTSENLIRRLRIQCLRRLLNQDGDFYDDPENTPAKMEKALSTYVKDIKPMIVAEIIENSRTIQLLTCSERLLDSYKEAQAAEAVIEMKSIFYKAINYVVGKSHIYFSMFIFYLAGITFLKNGIVHRDDAYYSIHALNMCAYGVVTFINLIPSFSEGTSAVDLIFKLIHRKPATGDIMDGLKPEIQGNISLKLVKLTYSRRPDHPALTNLIFLARSGQRIALVEPSGAGKSTCISILERFYDVCEGVIEIDGQDIRSLSLYWLRTRERRAETKDRHCQGISQKSQDSVVRGGNVGIGFPSGEGFGKFYNGESSLHTSTTLREIDRHSSNIIYSMHSEVQMDRICVVIDLFETNLFDFIQTKDIQNKIEVKVEDVLEGVSEGLAELHHCQITLNNLKPSNILLLRGNRNAKVVVSNLEVQMDRICVVIELFEANLFDFIRTKDLQDEIQTKVENILDGVSQGLAELHDCQITLNNLKPGNVLLSRISLQISSTSKATKGIPSSDMWLRYCYTEMCKYPFTWKEFVSRGYTLKPTYAAGFEKK